jgi:hypothetical protein
VQEYLCNRLNELSEPALEKYLLELVYIAVERPSSNLETAIIELCSKSFRIAVKVGVAALRRGTTRRGGPCARGGGDRGGCGPGRRVPADSPGPPQHLLLLTPAAPRALQTYWLLLALHQDHPKNKHIELFKDKCERSALEGHWVRGQAAPRQRNQRRPTSRCPAPTSPRPTPAALPPCPRRRSPSRTPGWSPSAPCR